MSLKGPYMIFLGANLRSGEVGIFPLAHVVDVEYSDFDPDVMSSLLLSENEKKERFLLDYLGSVETSLYKGNIVLCQAVKKIYSKEEDMCQLPTVLQITAKGIKMQNKVNNQVSLTKYLAKRPKKAFVVCTEIHTHCLKITQNVAFQFLNFGVFRKFLSY